MTVFPSHFATSLHPSTNRENPTSTCDWPPPAYIVSVGTQFVARGFADDTVSRWILVVTDVQFTAYFEGEVLRKRR